MVSSDPSQTDWPDLAGRLVNDEDGTPGHILPVRVYFEDTDFSGVVYHATYLRWCERGRSDFLRLLGNDHEALLNGKDGRPPAAFVVRRMELDFRAPARIDDVLTVRTHAANIGAAAIDLAQEIHRGEKLIFAASVQVVLVSLEGKPLRVGTALRAAFTAEA